MLLIIKKQKQIKNGNLVVTEDYSASTFHKLKSIDELRDLRQRLDCYIDETVASTLPPVVTSRFTHIYYFGTSTNSDFEFCDVADQIAANGEPAIVISSKAHDVDTLGFAARTIGLDIYVLTI